MGTAWITSWNKEAGCTGEIKLLAQNTKDNCYNCR
uniref:Uncharacterized protein n=1 Tax=Anguilla anguilla TaxID=7936 RepID=A0A0E9TFH8_ANGAN